MEMIQKEMPTPSCGCKKASTGLSTGFVVDIGAPIAAEDLKSYTTKDLSLSLLRLWPKKLDITLQEEAKGSNIVKARGKHYDLGSDVRRMCKENFNGLTFCDGEDDPDVVVWDTILGQWDTKRADIIANHNDFPSFVRSLFLE